MSSQEEQLVETEGDEIQTIEVSTSYNNQDWEKSNDDEFKEIPRDSKPLPARDVVKKKQKEVPEKNSDEVPISSSNSSNYDICRICHMGGSTSPQNCLTEVESPSRDERNIRSSSTNLDLGMLISACWCRGTVGLVHTKCLERWLTESGHSRCELCGYRYATIRVPRHGILRSLLVWIKTFVATRQMLLDSLYLIMTTPLAVFSAYVCAMTLKMALDSRVGDIPWTIVAMLPICSLTLVAYWSWLLTLQRLHGRRWRQYWQSNFIIQLIPDSPIVDSQNNEELDPFNREEIYEDVPDAFNLL
ncbi:hypothetical protein QAD02_019364 [Eretmocerus hayati]|uniref:Uncharacterized protein n=1 Tax=Eretmocerus hayati TaxID=131215 RepID=A0ACC2PJM4_9HYME|nr:hypothetical protein QAD02_019364 [Eretmocerus hayati]